MTRTYPHKVYTTNEARLLGTDGVVVYRGNWVDSMSLNYVEQHSANVRLNEKGGDFTISSPQRRLVGTYFLGFNSSHRNYAHWTTDQLPLLYYYKKKLMVSGVRLILPKNASSFLLQYLNILQIPRDFIEFVGVEVIEVEKLIYSSFFSFDAIPSSVISLIGNFKKEHLINKVDIRKKIFVSRKDTSIRSLLNEDRISQMLSEEGFETIVPGKLTVEQQIDAFHGADCVVGAHGAGLANVMFCRPQTQVIELFPEYTVSPHFWMLASYFGLKYGVIFGTSFDQDMALNDRSGSWEAPFVVNEEALKKSLHFLRMT